MNRKIKISFLLAIITVGFNILLAQTPKDDLSRGNYLVMQKPFQISAWASPIRIVDGVDFQDFDLDIFAQSNFTSFVSILYDLRWYPGPPAR